MSEPYVGEIRMFAGNFAPLGWLFCQGQLLPIAEYDTLFMLLGTTYGGDGQSNFALPDLRGRVPLHTSSAFPLGQAGGTETVQLTLNQLPAHNHGFVSNAAAPDTASPANAVPGILSEEIYGEDPPLRAYAAAKVGPQGGSQPHDNMQPYTCVSFIISTFGIFPSQS